MKRVKKVNVLISCACGYCGLTRWKFDEFGRERKYINHHPKKGKDSASWRGRRYKDHYGYWWIQNPDHHYAKQNGYVLEHRIIYEEYYKCCLLPWGNIHHINHKRDDNRIENLELISKPKHTRLHKIQDLSHRKCIICNTNVSS